MQPRNAGRPWRPCAIISPLVSKRAQLKSQASVTMRENAVRTKVTCASSTIVSSLFHHIVRVVASNLEPLSAAAIRLFLQHHNEHAHVIYRETRSGREDRS